MVKLEDLEKHEWPYKSTKLKLEIRLPGSSTINYLAKDEKDDLYVVKFGDHIHNEHSIMSKLKKAGSHQNVLTSCSLKETKISVKLNKLIASNVDVKYLVLPYLGQRDLLKFLNSRKIISPELTIDLSTQLADGLAYIHKNAGTHGDLKPDNVILVNGKKQGQQNLRPVIIDFDTIPGLEASITGSRYYLAPEVWSGHYSPQADLYSLGVIMFRALEGRLPFLGSTHQEAHQEHTKAPVPKLKNAPPSLAKIVTKLLAKAPTDRYQSAREVRREFLHVKG